MKSYSDLKTAGYDQVAKAIKAGGVLSEHPSPVYSGGYAYSYLLVTKRGASYRVSQQVGKCFNT